MFFILFVDRKAMEINLKNKNHYLRMSDEELVKKAQNDDNVALETILLRYKNLVASKAKTYFIAGADEDDMIQEGLIGLYNAIKKFDGERFPFFKVFALICVKRQILSAIREASRKKHKPLNSYISLDVSSVNNESDTSLSEIILSENDLHNPESMLINQEEFNSIETKINSSLSSFEFHVLMLYLEDRSYREIAQILKKDTKAIDNAIQRIKKKLICLRSN